MKEIRNTDLSSYRVTTEKEQTPLPRLLASHPLDDFSADLLVFQAHLPRSLKYGSFGVGLFVMNKRE